jgi:hypothetical protein
VKGGGVGVGLVWGWWWVCGGFSVGLVWVECGIAGGWWLTVVVVVLPFSLSSVKLKGWNYYFDGSISKVKSDGTYDIYMEEDKTTEKNVSEKYIKGTPPATSNSDSNNSTNSNSEDEDR